jgi:hypothetical protein
MAETGVLSEVKGEVTALEAELERELTDWHDESKKDVVEHVVADAAGGAADANHAAAGTRSVGSRVRNWVRDVEQKIYDRWKEFAFKSLQRIHDKAMRKLWDHFQKKDKSRQEIEKEAQHVVDTMVKFVRRFFVNTSHELRSSGMEGIQERLPEVSVKKRPATGELFPIPIASPFSGLVEATTAVPGKPFQPSPVVDTAAQIKLVDSLKKVLEYNGSPVKFNVDYGFENWGRTVHNRPFVAFEPTTVTGVKNIVKWAKEHDRTVRCSGFRHTWNDLYSGEDQVLISIIPISLAMNTFTLFPQQPVNPITDGLAFIQELNGGKPTPDGKFLLRIGASTTNDQFRQWCLDMNTGGKYKYTLPLNVIMVEITFGGSNAPICHGAGIKHETLSDLVHSIEFVNPLGELQTVDDPNQLKTAAGAFGLMGVVTAVTLKVDQMEYAEMLPNFTPVPESVPPMLVDDVPPALQKGWDPKNMPRDIAAFEKHCEEDYYTEWFWFSLQKTTWNNCWQTRKPNGDYRKESKTLSEWDAFGQSLLGIVAEATNGLTGHSGWLQTKLMGFGARMTLPSLTKPQLTPVIDALHFRRGIHNMRVLDMELEIELPLTAQGKPDWSICRQAWWDAIKLIYKHEAKGEYPCRLALEMRVMGGSGITMAPQLGFKNGTCSIEVLTSPQTPYQAWVDFMNDISDLWHSYTDPITGNPLIVRSHWAKQWQDLRLGPNKVPAVEYYHDVVYAEAIPKFREQLQAIASAGGYSEEDMKNRFSNSVLRTLIFDGPSNEPLRN